MNTHGNVGIIGKISDKAQLISDQSTHYTHHDLSLIKSLVTENLAQRADLNPSFPLINLPSQETTLQSIRN